MAAGRETVSIPQAPKYQEEEGIKNGWINEFLAKCTNYKALWIDFNQWVRLSCTGVWKYLLRPGRQVAHAINGIYKSSLINTNKCDNIHIWRVKNAHVKCASMHTYRINCYQVQNQLTTKTNVPKTKVIWTHYPAGREAQLPSIEQGKLKPWFIVVNSVLDWCCTQDFKAL